MFHNIRFREINPKATQSENGGGKGNTLTSKQIPGFPKAQGAVIKVGMTSNGFFKSLSKYGCNNQYRNISQYAKQQFQQGLHLN